MMTLEPTAIHPFERAGLGKAPFRFAGMSEKVYQACPGAPVQPGASCDYCSTGIRYCCHIQSADGKHFIVGTDCVLKLNREDNRLVSAVERAVLEMDQKKRQAKRQAAWDKQRAEREAELQAQRERNGGLTDCEAAEKQRREAEAARTHAMQAKNAWLLEVLAQITYQSGFVDYTKEALGRIPASELSDRSKDVLADIYAKAVSGKARRNSKEYEAAAEEFWGKLC